MIVRGSAVRRRMPCNACRTTQAEVQGSVKEAEWQVFNATLLTEARPTLCCLLYSTCTVCHCNQWQYHCGSCYSFRTFHNTKKVTFVNQSAAENTSIYWCSHKHQQHCFKFQLFSATRTFPWDSMTQFFRQNISLSIRLFLRSNRSHRLHLLSYVRHLVVECTHPFIYHGGPINVGRNNNDVNRSRNNFYRSRHLTNLSCMFAIEFHVLVDSSHQDGTSM